MIGRTSTQAMTNSITSQLLSAEAKYNTLNEKILTNQEVSKASDDPAAASKIAITNKQLNEYTMYTRSITNANMQIGSLENSLSQVTTTMERAAELVTQASSETNDLTTITPIQSELEELLKTVVTLANTQVDGQYIYSGSNTTTPAYTIDDDGNVTYHGSSKDADGSIRQLEISDGSYVPLNVTGDAIFGEYKVETDPTTGEEIVTASGIMGVLGNAIRAMNGTDVTDPTTGAVTKEIDYTQIRNQIDVIKSEVNNVSTERAQFGSYAQRLEMTQNSIDENEIIAEERRSDLQDIDVVKAISDLATQEYALQASMQVTSNILGNSLLDYFS